MQSPNDESGGASGVYAKRFDTPLKETVAPSTARRSAPPVEPDEPRGRARRVRRVLGYSAVVLVVALIGMSAVSLQGRSASSKFDSVARAICGPRMQTRSSSLIQPGVVGQVTWTGEGSGADRESAQGCGTPGGGGGFASRDVIDFPSAAPADGPPPTSSPTSAATSPAAATPASQTGFGPSAVGAPSEPETPGPAAAGHAFVSTATMTVMVEGDTAKAVAAQKRAALAIVANVGGGLFGEQSTFDGEAKVTITLKVPSAEFTKVLDQLGELGSPKSQDVKTDEVTGQVIDLEAKLIAATNGLQRAKDLLAKATTPTEVAQLEADLARRETDLETLRGQQAALRQRVELSTIVLTLVSSAPVAAPSPPPVAAPATPPPGFLDGLGAGWTVFAKVGTFVLAGLGALLPFLPVVLLVAVPWWLLRRRSRSRLTRAGTAGAPAAS